MKPMLKVLAVVGVVSMIAFITASSCDDKPGSGGGNSSVNYTSKGRLVFTNLATDLVTMDTTRVTTLNRKVVYIKLKASGFPTLPVSSDLSAHFGAVATAIPTRGSIKKAFDVKIEGATGGLLIVFSGGADSETLEPSRLPVIPAPKAFTNTASDDKGLHMIDGGTTPNGVIPSGLNFFSVFAEKFSSRIILGGSTPVPNAFSATETGTRLKPLFWCVTTIPGITNVSDTGIDALRVLNGSTLAGGEKVSCYVASLGATLSNADNAKAWFQAYEDYRGDDTTFFSKSVRLYFFAMQTDGKKIEDIGLRPNLGGAYKAREFQDGLDRLDMSSITQANPSGIFSGFDIEIIQ